VQTVNVFPLVERQGVNPLLIMHHSVSCGSCRTRNGDSTTTGPLISLMYTSPFLNREVDLQELLIAYAQVLITFIGVRLVLTRLEGQLEPS
jgi:hypothetical protein